MSARSRSLSVALLLGYAFLYAPIALLVVYSFNDSRLVTVWTGFSTRWYSELLANERIRDAATLSLGVAACAATLATAIGTLAGLAMARLGRFPGRLLFAALLAAPLVMPEVVTGLTLLLMFVALEQAIGWPAGRGFVTLVLAHASFGLAYVAVIVQARLAMLDPALEEAAADLGAPPARAFFAVTLPLIMPAVAAGWLLAFTLSLDDLVIASFTTGPGATTLPIYIFASVRLGVSPQINALASVLTLLVAAFGLAGWLLWRRASRV
jgi:putrescine transport system permease protein